MFRTNTTHVKKRALDLASSTFSRSASGLHNRGPAAEVADEPSNPGHQPFAFPPQRMFLRYPVLDGALWGATTGKREMTSTILIITNQISPIRSDLFSSRGDFVSPTQSTPIQPDKQPQSDQIGTQQ